MSTAQFCAIVGLLLLIVARQQDPEGLVDEVLTIITGCSAIVLILYAIVIQT
jgi:hypothetical protein